MKEERSELLHCAHYISRYLTLPENWIYKIITNQKHFKPIFLTRNKENLSLFPFSPIYSLDDYGKIRQYLEVAFFRAFGYFQFQNNACRQNKIVILHAHFGYHGIKLLGLKKKLKVPLVCSFYGDDAFAHPRVGNNIVKYRRLFKDADKILVLGPYMRAELMNLGCPEDKLIIHHLGIDVDRIHFEPRIMKEQGRVRFLIASSFVEKKGIEIAIKALSKLKDRHDFALDIIGDGVLRSKILDEIERSGIKDRITLHGYKPYDYFITLAYKSHVLIQASRTGKMNNKEGTPMAIVDAMATGMAIISTRHSDIPEIVIDGEHGFLAQENDLGSLTMCLDKLLVNPKVIEQFGRNGRARVEGQFNAKTQVKKLEGYYNQLLRRT